MTTRHSQSRYAALITSIGASIRKRRQAEREQSLWVADLEDLINDLEAERNASSEVDPVLVELDRAFSEIQASVEDTVPAGTENPACNFPQRVGRRKPRSAARDKRDVRKCRHLSGQGGTRSISALSPTSVHNTTPASHRPINAPSTRSKPYSPGHQKHVNADRNDKRKMASWRNTTDVAKMFAVGQAIEGGALAFSLNLAGDVRRYVDAHPTKAVRYMQDRLTKALAAEFERRVVVAFVLEVSPAGNVHLHGILDLDPAQKDRAVVALQKAGGTWAGRGACYQADARRIWDAAGWTRYCAKALERTKRALGVTNVLSIPQELRRRAREYWERMRWLEDNPV